MASESSYISGGQICRQFHFTSGEAEGFTGVGVSEEYNEAKGYGFLGIGRSSASIARVVDGYYQSLDHLTVLTQTPEGIRTQSGQYPIRFALKVKRNTYYKIRAKITAVGGNAEVTLTSERRHFVFTKRHLKKGESCIGEFTAAVHDVKWKNRDGGSPVPTVYQDDLLNIAVLGENAALTALSIRQIQKPRTIFIFGDSTVCDTCTSIPYNGFDTCAGWGEAMAKYVTPDTAVINLAEGGLSTGDRSYFEQGAAQIAPGDIVLLQMGHNEKTVEGYLANLEYYHKVITDAGARFVLCSPIMRLIAGQIVLPWTPTNVNTVYAPAARKFAAEKGIDFIDLNALTVKMNTELGTIRAWYLHTAYWLAAAEEAPSPNPAEASALSAHRDPTHMNDFGADNTCRLVAKELSVWEPELFADPLPEAMMPSEEFMKNGGAEYVLPPHPGDTRAFPYPSTGVSGYAAELSDFKTAEGCLLSVKVKRNIALSYITIFVEIYEKSKDLPETVQKRLEPSAAGTAETVFFEPGISIPKEGKLRLFVCNGAEIDGTLVHRPISEITALLGKNCSLH